MFTQGGNKNQPAPRHRDTIERARVNNLQRFLTEVLRSTAPRCACESVVEAKSLGQCALVFRCFAAYGSTAATERVRLRWAANRAGRRERQRKRVEKQRASERTKERERENRERGMGSEGAGGRERGQRRDGRGSVGDREMKAEGAWGMEEWGKPECRFYVHS